MDKEDSSPGTVYFAVSITLLFLMFWRTGGVRDFAPIAVAGVMAMTWGDAMASLIGKSIGKKTLSIFLNHRTLEGSIAMLVFSYLSVFLTLFYLSGSELSSGSVILSFNKALLISLPAALVATLAEGFSPAGTDNVTVPVLVALTLKIII
jgi:phytol kinase